MSAKKNVEQKQNTTYYRPPIITIMGHVDHGKTSLLDAIRESHITTTESGGITQHTGAYTVEKDGKRLTFIDTPGHEAFTEMRARGGRAADIVILVVAADDGVMPQTKEAIMHATAANVPIVVAINKCDLPGADIKKVKRQLSENNILVEGYGGDVVAVEVSATARTGIDNLLDVLNLVAEINNEVLVADPKGLLNALIIEANHDSKRGPVVSVVVKNGTLSVRDDVIAGMFESRVKSLTNSNGKRVDEALPGDAVEILGFTELPQVGDIVKRKSELTEEEWVDKQANSQKLEASPEEFTATEIEGEEGKKILNLIVRADTSGTLEAIISSIQKIEVEDAEPRILFSGVGDVKESDILLASTSKAVVIAFRVGVSSATKEFAQVKKIIIREHEIIYHLLEEIEGALEGVVEIEEAKIRGKGIVIKTFNLPKSGMIVCGTLITGGKFKPRDRIGIFRGEDKNPLYITRIRSIHLGKAEVERAVKGEEVGLLFKPQIEDIQLEDRIEIF